MMKEYIRFGEIPDNERSGIYNNEGELIGRERGVSCYECICFNNQYRVYYHIDLLDIHV